ncbi:MAG: prophage tail fiber N-terminal domain-containing protein [Gilliamella sp.]|uniref:phage tail fiber protein n=1 Tax=Gilliamella sp. TaxID=1891236 RepID=UPI002600E45C|nr:prophage tail fiber N-terminal domain-containing protein [Gilliamella sp.]MCO6537288.1 prophage tail fiber N-terminal domain-containing protein [Gilliamella sp.]
MAKISGVLTDGAGNIINNCTIELYAKKTTSKVLTQTQAFQVANNGSYMMNVLPCDYEVKLIINGFPPKRLGTIQVFSDSKDGTLNDFLLNPPESEITPAILQQVVNARNAAKKSADDAKKWASTIDTSKLVKKSGDEITGQMRFSPTSYGIKFLHENKNELVMRPSGDSFIYAYYNSESNTWTNKLRYVSNGNTWRFENVDDVAINGKSALKKGDYGLGSNVGVRVSDLNEKLPTAFYYTTTDDIADLPFIGGRSSASLLPLPTSSATWGIEMLSVVNSKTPKIFYRCSTSRGKENWYEAITTANVADFTCALCGDLFNKNLNELTGSNEGVYFQSKNIQATIENGYPINQAGTLQVLKNGADGAGCCQIYTTYRSARQFIRNYRGGTKTWEPWVEQITTANSTVDSNGFLKKASPILRLFANDNIEESDGFKKSGFALVNDFAYGVTATRIDVGHYEIHGSLGFAKEGWYITLPEDANGNKKFFAEYSVDENNVITVKTYTKKFDFENCQIVAGKPIDITEGRWIDIRLEMPVVEVIENEEPIPSTLNPVIVSEVSDDI